MKTIQLGPFLGLNNRRPDFSLHIDKVGDYLRAADNVDIDNAGNIIRRRGATRLQAMSNAHSLNMKTVSTGFLVRASALYAVTLPAYSETLLEVLASDAVMSYAQLGTDWYFSNGTDIGRVTAGVAYPIGFAAQAAPALAVIGGSLLTGQYQVGIAYTNTTTGEEGALSELAYQELTTTGGIRVTLPGALTGATHVNVYLTDSNGTMPMLHSTVTTATATIDLTTLATGRPSAKREEAPLPAGTLFVHNGRLCSFSGDKVYVGLSWRPGYYLPLDGFIWFPDTVTIAAPNEGGVYIAADKTYWFPGDIGNIQDFVVENMPYGAVPGTFFKAPNKKVVGWFSVRGFVTADAAGAVDTTMADNVTVTPPAIGTAGICECNGFRRVVSCGYAMNTETKAVTTYSDYDFTSLSRCFGTKADGIYQTDTDVDVDATVGLGKLDFDSEQIKYMPVAYLGMSSAEPMNLRVQTPARGTNKPAQDQTYATRASGTGLQQQRITPGKGMCGNWFDLELSNTDGADFTLATVSFGPRPTTRRI